MNDQTVHARMADLMERLDDDTQAGLPELQELVRDYTSSSQLKARTIMLAADIEKARRIGSDQSFQSEVLELAQEAAAELQEVEPDRLASRLARRQEARKSLAGRQIDDRLVVEAKGLGKRFKEFHLDNVDLSLRLGRITGVVGENANGKTTLFRLLVGQLKHDEGTLAYPEFGSPDPDKVKWAEVRNNIAYVPQTLTPWHGSLEENLRFAAASHGILGAENDNEFRYITERLGLTEYLGRDWSEISGAISCGSSWRAR
uniref:ATP-binding cassette domain-containing protein n=1 Tax=Yoonia rhodophyticola TaxID=3137370 RepID=A0AAN0MFU6_9RHOB